jgi:hypothetical protein
MYSPPSTAFDNFRNHSEALFHRRHFRDHADPSINLAGIAIREIQRGWRLKFLTHFAGCVCEPNKVVAMQDRNWRCRQRRTQNVLNLARNWELSKTIVIFDHLHGSCHDTSTNPELLT